MFLPKPDASLNPLLVEAARNLIARRLQAEAYDPVLLALRVGITPDEWQRNLLRSTAKQLILLCSRQSGKSTITAILALHEALYNDDALVLILSPSMRQSTELFRKIKDSYNTLANVCVLTRETTQEIEFENGSRIVSLPGADDAKIRGFSGVTLLIVDEASRVLDPLYQGIRPMLAVSGGRIVLLSTPWGKRGFFFEEWENGGDAWHRTKITAKECPRISPEFLEQERRQIGDWWFAQEYLCEFVDTTDQVFRSEDIQAMFSSEVKPLWQ